MRLVMAIGLFLGGMAAFWVAFHSAAVPKSPTPGGVLAALRDELKGVPAESAAVPGQNNVNVPQSAANAVSDAQSAASSGGSGAVSAAESAAKGLEHLIMSPAAAFLFHL
jgi:hypothetical protein